MLSRKRDCIVHVLSNTMRNIRSSLLASILITFALFNLTAFSDVIQLRGGAEIHGVILKRSATYLWVDIGDSILTINAAEVENIFQDHSEIDEQTIDTNTLYRTLIDLPERSAKAQAKLVGASVIKVSTPRAIGSGVFLNEEGYAVTNAHVIQGETDIRVTVWIPQPDKTLKRTTIEDVVIIAVNNHLDLALLLISHPDDTNFDYSVLEYDESIQVGQSVFAIGNPLGLERTMSKGVISTKQRNFDGLTYIQTDAAINPGNSGGPLFNNKGEVVGITNMGITAAESLNFAIPTRYVKDFIRNREAFAYDEKNPNSGHIYHIPPTRSEKGTSKELTTD